MSFDAPPFAPAGAALPRVPLSFELYPPRTTAPIEALHETIQQLATVAPRFISVTYGAGGSVGGRSLDVLRYIREHTSVEPLAHLTCVGNTYAGASRLIREFLDAGILSFLALRGDPPLDESEPFLGDLESSAQLVQLIDRAQAERAPYQERPFPGVPGAVQVTPRRKVSIAVAAYPNGHPRSTYRNQDIDALLAKQAAGATLAITQLFFHPDDYFAFVERARRAGVTIPILPGIMPITSPARLRRVLELSGEELPAELSIALEVEPTVEGRTEIGVAHAASLVRELVDGGAPGVHLYAFNQHRTVLDVLEGAGVLPERVVGSPHGAPKFAESRGAHEAASFPLPSERTVMTAFPEGTVLGYPRIGRRRELKKAVEAFWAGRIDEAELERTTAELRATTRERLAAQGLGRADSAIPESFSYYDQVLDAAVAVGAIPARFENLRSADGTIGLPAYFTIARGEGERAPLEMTKWFDTNYHYLVPEIGPDTVFSLSSDRIVRQVEEAAQAGFRTRPVIVGPVTFLALAKAADEAPEGFDPLSRLDDLVPVYAELLGALKAAGAEWVQLDEPALVSEALPASAAVLGAAAERAYALLGGLAERPAIFVAAPYAALDANLAVLAAAPIEAIGLDLVRGAVPAAVPGLADKVLVGGVIDGHNIWRGDLAAAFDTLEALRGLGAAGVSASTSTSLQHVPHDVEDESKLDARLVSWLAFADQKVAQVTTLAKGLAEGRSAIAAELDAASAALTDRLGAPGVRVDAVRARTAALTGTDFDRGDYDARVAAQSIALDLPALPLTTIGSFPQTGEIRRARAQFTKGEITAAEYDGFLRDEIGRVVTLQEELGLDVLVHGEPERNDMVQYFAENLDGFDVTENGWVQSYGSRATRPSILWGDVSRPAPITVAWSQYAQSLTAKPMKGMLTGPVTILAWSFVRDDQPLAETANQVALALRDEIADLEAAGIGVIQVDEPALRELLPLKKGDQPAYLDWSVASFRLSTAGAETATQVHTHLCYSEFGVVIDAIRALDADVTSIEAARSRMEVVTDIAASGFDHGIGPGVYDIHSPRVPDVSEVEALLRRAVEEIPTRQLWVNPDCGLKTRGYEETNASLRNIVEATRRVREDVSVAV